MTITIFKRDSLSAAGSNARHESAARVRDNRDLFPSKERRVTIYTSGRVAITSEKRKHYREHSHRWDASVERRRRFILLRMVLAWFGNDHRYESKLYFFLDRDSFCTLYAKNAFHNGALFFLIGRERIFIVQFWGKTGNFILNFCLRFEAKLLQWFNRRMMYVPSYNNRKEVIFSGKLLHYFLKLTVDIIKHIEMINKICFEIEYDARWNIKFP